MRKGFIPMHGAEGWQISNAQIFSFAAHKASLDIFDKAGMDALRAKSLVLTGALERIIQELDPNGAFFKIITPKNEQDRGCQLSLLTQQKGKEIFDALNQQGIISDWREPNVIRFAPVPLYNSLTDVEVLGTELARIIHS